MAEARHRSLRTCFGVVLIGLWEAISYVALGAVYCITIIGIPIGLQLFKMAKLSLLPFGARVVDAS